MVVGGGNADGGEEAGGPPDNERQLLETELVEVECMLAGEIQQIESLARENTKKVTGDLPIMLVCAGQQYRHSNGHQHYWVCLLLMAPVDKVSVVPNDFTGTIKKVGNCSTGTIRGYTCNTCGATTCTPRHMIRHEVHGSGS